MRHGSLESGIGGFDYAAEQLGWTNVFHCEINPFCQKILKYYFPHAASYADIFEMDGTEWRGKVDIITAGFPCQPFSHAGKRKGTQDDRFIWAENLRIFREARPPFIVAENVPGLLTIENGMVFERVCADLENEGYEVTPLIIPACGKDAVHLRYRIWIVAYSESKRERSGQSYGNIGSWQQLEGTEQGRNGINDNSNATDNPEQGLQKPGQTGIRELSKESGAGLHNRPKQRNSDDTDSTEQRLERSIKTNGIERAQRNDEFMNGRGGERNETWLEAATRLCSVDDGFTGRLDAKTISKGKWRTTESLKGYGNAIYWKIAYEIFKSIEKTI